MRRARARRYDRPVMIAVAPEHLRLLRWGGLAAWLGVGLPIWLQLSAIQRPGAFAGWLAAWLLFAAAFWVSSGGVGGRELTRREDLLLLALQVACVLVVVLLLCDGFEGTLLVLVAMQLAARVSRRTGLLWIAAQSLLLAVAIGIHWKPGSALLLVPPYPGFRVLAFLAFAALEELARTNAELRSARELLAHGSRVAERLRIARELHDAVGHRLVALSLNL